MCDMEVSRDSVRVGELKRCKGGRKWYGVGATLIEHVMNMSRRVAKQYEQWETEGEHGGSNSKGNNCMRANGAETQGNGSYY